MKTAIFLSLVAACVIASLYNVWSETHRKGGKLL